MTHSVVLSRVDQDAGWTFDAVCLECEWTFTGEHLLPGHEGPTDSVVAARGHMAETKAMAQLDAEYERIGPEHFLCGYKECLLGWELEKCPGQPPAQT